ncbi:MAG: hypothetical protein G01um101470_490 [Parcubacteria group bacterium Gr01-1014_70]|nr:MAG: hypothetical protein G01um101470_490 [Parcubacteria group bacterium Gr01-1014_70]
MGYLFYLLLVTLIWVIAIFLWRWNAFLILSSVHIVCAVVFVGISLVSERRRAVK